MSAAVKESLKIAGTYGVALSALAAAEVAEATVIELTPVPGTLAAGGSGTLSLTGPATAITMTYSNAGGSLALYGSLQLGIFAFGATITTGAFTTTSVRIPHTQTGVQTIGVSWSGRVGWFRIDMGAAGIDDVPILAAAFSDTPGESVIAGVPEPATGALTALGLLALGARGRRTRRARATSRGA